MARRLKRGGSFPHAKYGVDLSKVPDTYIEPFVAYRAWNWTETGIMSLNHSPWTPKIAFEATCEHTERTQGMLASCTTPEAKEYWAERQHQVPDPGCTCGMYAGINMQHLINIGYIQRGIHGEVYLWGRLYKHTLGWRAQYAYPKNFIVPANMIPFKLDEAKQRLDSLVQFDVDIHLQTENEAQVGQTTIPLWMKDYGYTSQGLSWLVEKRAKWYEEHPKTARLLQKGDRVAVFDHLTGGGIGIVESIEGDEMFYTMFSPNVIYHKSVKDVLWNERNWRWETSGTGGMRRLSQAMGKI